MSSDNVDLMRLEAFGSVALVAVARAGTDGGPGPPSDAGSGADAGALARAVQAVERTAADFDKACSRFRDDSELSAVNAAAGRPVSVGPTLLEAVNAALRAARLTGGDVDPTVGRAMLALGYDRDFDLLETASASSAVTPPAHPVALFPGWRAVQVDAERGTIRVAPGVMLDLGATAKALAADRAAAAAHEAAGCGVLVSFGGDLAIVGPPPPEGWRVRVTDDHRAGVDAPGQWISLRSGGLATSSTSVRRWRTDSGVAHHLVDPATGGPVDSPWRTVSVAAASCLDANVASTAAIIRGRPAVSWLEGSGLPSRLVDIDGTVRHVAGWPAEGDDLPVVSLAGVGPGAAGA